MKKRRRGKDQQEKVKRRQTKTTASATPNSLPKIVIC
jgi:hypothetical protein